MPLPELCRAADGCAVCGCPGRVKLWRVGSGSGDNFGIDAARSLVASTALKWIGGAVDGRSSSRPATA